MALTDEGASCHWCIASLNHCTSSILTEVRSGATYSGIPPEIRYTTLRQSYQSWLRPFNYSVCWPIRSYHRSWTI